MLIFMCYPIAHTRGGARFCRSAGLPFAHETCTGFPHVWEVKGTSSTTCWVLRTHVCLALGPSRHRLCNRRVRRMYCVKQCECSTCSLAYGPGKTRVAGYLPRFRCASVANRSACALAFAPCCRQGNARRRQPFFGGYGRCTAGEASHLWIGHCIMEMKPEP